MPEHFFGLLKNWEKLEAPLKEIDGILEPFCQKHGMSLGKNYHGWPERSLTWGRPISRLIQIYLESEQSLTYNMWICAFQDREGKRYWKNGYMKRSVSIEEISQNLDTLLEEGRSQLEMWTPNDLEVAI